MATLDDAIRALITGGATPEQIALRATKLSAEPVKEHFLSVLIDRSVSPQRPAARLVVSAWDPIDAFFEMKPTDEFHPQRIYQDLITDIGEARVARNGNALFQALMMTAKAVQA